MLCCGNLGSSVALRSFSRVGSSTVNGPARLGAVFSLSVPDIVHLGSHSLCVQCVVAGSVDVSNGLLSVWILPVSSGLCASRVVPRSTCQCVQWIFAVAAQLHSIWSFSFGLQFGSLRIGIFTVCSGLYSFRELSLSQRLSVLWLRLVFIHEFDCELILCRVPLIWVRRCHSSLLIDLVHL